MTALEEGGERWAAGRSAPQGRLGLRAEGCYLPPPPEAAQWGALSAPGAGGHPGTLTNSSEPKQPQYHPARPPHLGYCPPLSTLICMVVRVPRCPGAQVSSFVLMADLGRGWSPSCIWEGQPCGPQPDPSLPSHLPLLSPWEEPRSEFGSGQRRAILTDSPDLKDTEQHLMRLSLKLCVPGFVVLDTALDPYPFPHVGSRLAWNPEGKWGGPKRSLDTARRARPLRCPPCR